MTVSDSVNETNTGTTNNILELSDEVSQSLIASAEATGIIISEDQPTSRKDGGLLQPGDLWYQTEEVESTTRVKAVRVYQGVNFIPYAFAAQDIIALGTIVANHLAVDALDFKTAQGMILTAATMQTHSAAGTGVKMTPYGISAWNSDKVRTIWLDTDGNASFTGRVTLRDTSGDDSVEIANRTITIKRSDGDGGSRTSLTIGGASSDQIILMGSDGQPQHAFYAGGNATIRRRLTVENLTVNGSDIFDLLGDKSTGIVAQFSGTSTWSKFGTNEMGICAVGFTAKAWHRYRVVFQSLFSPDTAGDRFVLRSRYRWQSDGNLTVSSPVLQTTNHITTVGNITGYHETYFAPGESSGWVALGMTASNISGNRGIQPTANANTPIFMYVEDLGIIDSNFTSGYTLLSGSEWSPPLSPPPPPVETLTRTFNATWTQTWRGGSPISDGTLHHGTYGGYSRYSMVGFSDSSLSSLFRGGTIIKAELGLQNLSWWGSTGSATIVPTGFTSAPSSPVTTGTEIVSSGWGAGQFRWVNVTSGMTNSVRSFALGADAPSSTTYYGKFDRDVSNIRLRVTVRK